MYTIAAAQMAPNDERDRRQRSAHVQDDGPCQGAARRPVGLSSSLRLRPIFAIAYRRNFARYFVSTTANRLPCSGKGPSAAHECDVWVRRSPPERLLQRGHADRSHGPDRAQIPQGASAAPHDRPCASNYERILFCPGDLGVSGGAYRRAVRRHPDLLRPALSRGIPHNGRPRGRFDLQPDRHHFLESAGAQKYGTRCCVRAPLKMACSSWASTNPPRMRQGLLWQQHDRLSHRPRDSGACGTERSDTLLVHAIDPVDCAQARLRLPFIRDLSERERAFYQG